MANRENFVRHSFYTTASPEDFWIEIAHSPIYRASKSRNNPKFLTKGKFRFVDFKMAIDPLAEDRLILPHPKKGLSFANSIDTLRNKRVSGRYLFKGQTVWEITPGPLPEGLVENYTDKT